MTSLPPCNPPDALATLLSETLGRLRDELAGEKARRIRAEEANGEMQRRIDYLEQAVQVAAQKQ